MSMVVVVAADERQYDSEDAVARQIDTDLMLWNCRSVVMVEWLVPSWAWLEMGRFRVDRRDGWMGARWRQ